MCPALATVVRAGIKPGESMVSYLATIDTSSDSATHVAAMEEAVPPTLADLCAGIAKAESEAEEALGVTPGRVWATMLALVI
eukprot:1194307-Prorocentrum_minimum.AAC.1